MIKLLVMSIPKLGQPNFYNKTIEIYFTLFYFLQKSHNLTYVQAFADFNSSCQYFKQISKGNIKVF